MDKTASHKDNNKKSKKSLIVVVCFILSIAVVVATVFVCANSHAPESGKNRENNALTMLEKLQLTCHFDNSGFSCSSINGVSLNRTAFFTYPVSTEFGRGYRLYIMDRIAGFQVQEIFDSFEEFFDDVDEIRQCSIIFLGIGGPSFTADPKNLVKRFGIKISIHTAEKAFEIFKTANEIFKTANDPSICLYLVHNEPKPLDSQLCIEHGNELMCFDKESIRTSIRSGLLIPSIENSPKKVLEFKRGFRGAFIPEVMDEFVKASEVCKKIIVAVDYSLGAKHNFAKYGNFFNKEKTVEMTIKQALETFDNQTKGEDICVFAVKEAEPSCKIEDDLVVCGEVKGKSVLVLEDKAVVLNINEKGAWNQADISAEDRELMNPLSVLISDDYKAFDSTIKAVFWPSNCSDKSKLMFKPQKLRQVFYKFQTEKFVISTLKKERPFCRVEKTPAGFLGRFLCGDGLLEDHGFVNSNGELFDVEKSLVVEPKMNEAWNREIAHLASQCKSLFVASYNNAEAVISSISEFNSRFNGVGMPTTDGACLYFRIE